MPPGLPTSEAPAPGRRSLKEQLLSGAVPKLLVSLLIAGGFAWLLARGGLPLVPEQSLLGNVAPWGIAAFASCHLVAVLLRTYRWVFLLRPIAPRIKALRVLGIGLVGYSAIFLAPLRMGEVVRPYLLAQDGEVSFMQAAGTLFAERVIDGLVLTLVTFVSLSLATMVSPLPHALADLPLPVAAVPVAVYTATLAFFGLFVAMLAFYAARHAAGRFTRAVVGVVSPRAGDWAASTLERVADGLRFLPSRRHLFSFLSLTIASWGCVMGGQLLVMRSAGLPATFLQSAAMVGILALGSIVPAGPGLFGAYQISAFTALALYFPLAEVKSSGAALIFVTYVAHVSINSLQFVLGSLLMSRVRPASPA